MSQQGEGLLGFVRMPSQIPTLARGGVESEFQLMSALQHVHFHTSSPVNLRTQYFTFKEKLYAKVFSVNINSS